MINFEEVYQYLNENEPEIANSICYASEMLLSHIDEAIETLKKRKVEAAENDNDSEYNRLTGYRNNLKDCKRAIETYLNYATNKIDSPSNTELHCGEQFEQYTNIVDNDEKIGKHVKKCMRELEAKNYTFSHNELLALLNAQKSKDIFGISFPFFVNDKNMIYDQNGIGRYWVDPFRFNGKLYYITSQWYVRQRVKFDDWFKEINKV